MNDTNRGTGRTTRTLELVVAETKKDTPLVIVVVHAPHFISYATGILRRLTDAHVQNNISRDIVIGATRVRFMVDSDDLEHRLAGLGKNVPLFYDHAVWEYRNAKLLSA
jgi:hypothetical protein